MSSTAKPTVVIVMPLAQQRGGAELALLALVSSETSIVWHTIFLEDGPMLAEFHQKGLSAQVIEAGRVRQPLKMINAIRAIAKFARGAKADAMLGWMAKAHLYSGSAAKLAGIPAVWFQHGLPTIGGVIDELANRIPAVGALACSAYSAEAQLKVTPRLEMKVVYAPTDLSRFDPGRLRLPGECREALSLPVRGPLIGIFGRLQSWKGMHVLVDAMPAVLAKYPQATALVVGGIWEMEAEYEKKLHDRARTLGIENRVIFAGHQTNIADWMQACDIIVHASDREPFGMVVVEAMALGKPVIAGATGGPREVVTDNVDGFLVGFEDTAGMTGAILRYLDDPEMARRMGEAGRARAQHFSLQRFGQSVSEQLKYWIYSRSGTRAETVHAS
jgi:glycosyltransferase involved in cell wall biosynthesis